MGNLERLLHPVRLRILRAMLDGRPCTTGQLRDRLPDIAQATMYRHVAALVAAGVLEIQERHRAQGSVGRTYQVRWDRTAIGTTHRPAVLWLTDDEFTGLIAEIRALITTHQAKGPGQDRRHRVITLIAVPTDNS